MSDIHSDDHFPPAKKNATTYPRGSNDGWSRHRWLWLSRDGRGSRGSGVEPLQATLHVLVILGPGLSRHAHHLRGGGGGGPLLRGRGGAGTAADGRARGHGGRGRGGDGGGAGCWGHRRGRLLRLLRELRRLLRLLGWCPWTDNATRTDDSARTTDSWPGHVGGDGRLLRGLLRRRRRRRLSPRSLRRHVRGRRARHVGRRGTRLARGDLPLLGTVTLLRKQNE
jgi:hypothetical protein